jgi:hypothetical protein
VHPCSGRIKCTEDHLAGLRQTEKAVELG